MMLSRTHSRPGGDARRLFGYYPDVSILLVPLIVALLFVLPFFMAWLEPKKAPARRSDSRRTNSR
jgi:hypothetical protein